MTTYLFANNANSALAAPISSSDTTLSVTAGTGARFPSPAVDQVFTITLNDQATGDVYEIMLCTGVTGDVLTVERAQEGTSAVAWAAGDFVANFLTAGTAAIFVQGGGTLGTMSNQNANAVAITGGAIYGVTLASTRGNTAARPAPPPFLGCQYFDTDLGQPIWASSIGPNLWVNAAGVSV
jgi:hypothetical protein